MADCKHKNYKEVIDHEYPATRWQPAEYVYHIHCNDCQEDFNPDDFDFETADSDDEEEEEYRERDYLEVVSGE